MSSASIFVSRSTSAPPRAAGCEVEARASLPDGRRDLLREPLQRPVATPHDVGGHVGQRDDRADLLALAA